MTDALAVDLNYRKLWLALGWLLVGVVVYASLTSSTPETLPFDDADKFGHLLAYAVLMGWFCQLFWSISDRLKLAAAFAVMGISLEFAQALTGYRSFDYADMLANVLGVAGGWMAIKTRLRYSLSAFDRYISAVTAG
ncbi:MAG: VanZ family protein [Burkholderiales bacterium]|nr:VanZ family protein [Burkholderiales bacterium]MDQ3194883.1 VanZ family protein [Pseudomonadota bacterium]